MESATTHSRVPKHGISANVFHRWHKLARGDDAKAPPKTCEFIALPLTMAPAPVSPSAPMQAELRLELRRGATTMSIT